MKTLKSIPYTQKFIETIGVACFIAIFSLTFSGCKIQKKSDRDAQAARDQAAAQQEQQTETASQQQAALELKQKQTAQTAIDNAKTELRDRIDLYEALAGDYTGSYIANENTAVQMETRIRVSNEPAKAEIEAMNRESTILQRVDQISLDIQSHENLPGETHQFVCRAQNIKPDFKNGLIEFTCQGNGDAGSRRDYSLAFAPKEDLQTEHITNIDTGVSAKVGSELISGQLQALGGFSVSILLNPAYGTHFSGLILKRIER